MDGPIKPNLTEDDQTTENCTCFTKNTLPILIVVSWQFIFSLSSVVDNINDEL